MNKSGHLLFLFSCVCLILGYSDCEFDRFINCCADNDNVAFTNVLFILLLLLLYINVALLSLSVFGDHELGVFITVGDPGNGGQAGRQRQSNGLANYCLQSLTASLQVTNLLKKPDIDTIYS